MCSDKKTALVLLFDGIEELEVVAPIDLLRRAGIEVTVASLGSSKTVTGRNGIVIAADTTIESVADKDHDVLIIPGGPGIGAVRKAGSAAKLAAKQAAGDGWLAAICAAPTVLKDAGLLEHRQYTAHFSVRAELSEMMEGKAVVQDGRIITSRGAGTAIPFALEIIRALMTEEAAHSVAASICLEN